ncbi:hypothetical protein FDG95_gp099 [Pectobacterium phage vB_PcaM_CBB]|uniref:Uncharacterized protein n=1 Tax=Pectobacterium phage vB_PcaM_CBB TaxID=2772511 RepID=A0A1L2CUG6_9CAUD|nr:hypothetical protein FDG95_gp099 [Pectobacterium phage vB_PcaM_CBB]AMM43664.1 hypothetical protein CBB_99 [Pectobacterium phage vB_PcaM_CBB]
MVAIPEKFYVTRVYRSAEEVLGWMVVADKEHTKAFQEAKRKADAWATPYHRHGQTNPDPGMEAIYVDNTPRKGFRMVTNVSRYSTSNVVWRIMHPEGFEFEITSDNLCDLLETNTIIEGEFQDEMFFTHNKKLVNEKTKLFADLIEREEKKKELKEKAKDMPLGTRLIYKHYKGNRTFMYCGKAHAITVNANKPFQLSAKSSLRIVVKEISTGQYHMLSSVSSDYEIIEQFGDDAIDINEVVQQMNEQIKNSTKQHMKYYHNGYVPNEVIPITTSVKPFKREQLKLEYTPVDPKTIQYINGDKVFLYDNAMIFGFAWCNTQHYGRSWQETADASYYSSHHTMTHLRTYPIAGVNENGYPVLDIDISGHKTIGYGRGDSVFRSINGGSYDRGIELKTVPMPNEVLMGQYVIGE